MFNAQCAAVIYMTHSSLPMQPDGIQGSSPGGSERDCATDVDAGAEKDPEYHTTDLRTASARGYVKRVRLLLDQGAEVNKYWHVSFE